VIEWREVHEPLPPPRPTPDIPLPPPRPSDLTAPPVETTPVPPSAKKTPVAMPPPRPADLGKPPAVSPAAAAPVPVPTPVPAPAPAPPPAPALLPDPTCPHVLADKNLVVAAAPPISGPNGCGILAPVVLSAVILTDGTRVPFEPPSTIRCDLAEALGTWVREDVAPAVASAGGLAKILGSNGYVCRTRDWIPGAILSEHGKGNALDITGLVLRTGTTVPISRDAAQKPAFLAKIKAGACARFMTVLGPGADAFHAAHLHVDLLQRHNNFRICEWDAN
jgi:hypothetical protein